MTASTRTLPRPATTADGGRLLRLALRVDAAASGALGALATAAAARLTDLLGPAVGVLQGVGAFLLVYAAGLLALSALPRMPRPAVWTVVIGNALWACGSVAATIAGWSVLTGLGVAVVLAQALAVAVFAELQWLGLRRAR